LLFYSEKKRYWTRYGDEDEKDHYKEVVKYNKREKEKRDRRQAEEFQRIQKLIKEKEIKA